MSTISDYTGKISCMVAGGLMGLALNQLLLAHFAAALVLGGVAAIFIAIAKVMFDQYDRFLKQVGR